MRENLKAWAPLINTLLLIITIISLAVAGEHRITVVETRLNTVEQAVIELKDINKSLVGKQGSNAENIVRAAAILQATCESLNALELEVHEHIVTDK